MHIKTYTGFVNGEEIREVYSNELHSIIRVYKENKPYDLYRVMKRNPESIDDLLIGLAINFDYALNMIIGFRRIRVDLTSGGSLNFKRTSNTVPEIPHKRENPITCSERVVPTEHQQKSTLPGKVRWYKNFGSIALSKTISRIVGKQNIQIMAERLFGCTHLASEIPLEVSISSFAREFALQTYTTLERNFPLCFLRILSLPVQTCYALRDLVIMQTPQWKARRKALSETLHIDRNNSDDTLKVIDKKEFNNLSPQINL